MLQKGKTKVLIMIRLVLAFFLTIFCCLSIPTNALATDEKIPAVVNIRVDGDKYELYAFNSDGHNYVKLQDLAFLLRNSEKAFSVSNVNTSGLMNIRRIDTYSINNPTTSPITSINTMKSTTTLMIKDNIYKLDSLTVNGQLFFRLHDLAQVLNLKPVWDAHFQVISVNTKLDYVPDIQMPYFTRINKRCLQRLRQHSI
jgi:hypothetical protein